MQRRLLARQILSLSSRICPKLRAVKHSSERPGAPRPPRKDLQAGIAPRTERQTPPPGPAERLRWGRGPGCGPGRACGNVGRRCVCVGGGGGGGGFRLVLVSRPPPAGSRLRVGRVRRRQWIRMRPHRQRGPCLGPCQGRQHRRCARGIFFWEAPSRARERHPRPQRKTHVRCCLLAPPRPAVCRTGSRRLGGGWYWNRGTEQLEFRLGWLAFPYVKNRQIQTIERLVAGHWQLENLFFGPSRPLVNLFTRG